MEINVKSFFVGVFLVVLVAFSAYIATQINPPTKVIIEKTVAQDVIIQVDKQTVGECILINGQLTDDCFIYSNHSNISRDGEELQI